jgi:hypothetical protein
MLLTGSTFSWNVAGLFSGLTALAIVLLGIVVLIRGRGSDHSGDRWLARCARCGDGFAHG